MFYIYVLKSKQDDKLYIGYTTDLKKRFIEHSQGLVKSTRPRKPFDLVYYEAYASGKDAKMRESALKKFSGSMIHLRRRIANSIVSK